MERVVDAGQSIEVFENDIDLHLQLFCENHNIEDMSKESQSRWNAALMYIRRQVFPDPKILKARTPYAEYVNNTNGDQDYRRGLNRSTCGRYDYDLVNEIADYYIYLCMEYDKEVSILGFCNLTGIEYATINTWDNGQRLSTTAIEIAKKLKQYREESLSNKLVTGKQNPVGTIAVLNRQFGWASPYTSDANRQKVSLTNAQLPDLSSEKAGIEDKAPDIVVSEQ